MPIDIILLIQSKEGVPVFMHMKMTYLQSIYTQMKSFIAFLETLRNISWMNFVKQNR